MKSMLLSLLVLALATTFVYVFAEAVKRTRPLGMHTNFAFRALVPFPLTIGLWGILFVLSMSYPYPQGFGLRLWWVIGSMVLTACSVLLLFSMTAATVQTARSRNVSACGFVIGMLLAQAILVVAMHWQPMPQWNGAVMLSAGIGLWLSTLGLIWFSREGVLDPLIQHFVATTSTSWGVAKLSLKILTAILIGLGLSGALWLALLSLGFSPETRSLVAMTIDADWMGGFVGVIVLGFLSVMFFAGLLSDRAERRASRLAQELSENADTLKKVHELDRVTHLLNRPAIEAHLQRLIQEVSEKQELFTVFYVGLDAFRTVNDSLGFASGDNVLGLVAERIKQALATDDLVARVGGDEYVMVARYCNSPADAAVLGKRLLGTLAHVYTLPQQDITLTASVGVALYPQDGRSAAELLTHANYAMSNVKRTGRNNFCFYSAHMETTVRHELQLQGELRTALSERQMEMFFQPQFTMDDMRLVGCEALVRWRMPDGGLRMPDSFIPLAERTGLIIPLGLQVLELSCQAACRWYRQQGYWIWVGVNVSALQFQQADFIENVSRVIEKTGILPQALVLEVTESTAMSNAEGTLQKFSHLNDLGVRIAIDDFGTGYSSLAYLKRFKFHHIKIDRSFVNDLGESSADQHIVKAIIDLGHNFGVETVAEGVERDDQHALLRKLGCSLGQGYLYGKPMCEKDFISRFLLPDAASVPPRVAKVLKSDLQGSHPETYSNRH